MSPTRTSLVLVAVFGFGALLSGCRGGPDGAHVHEKNLPPPGPSVTAKLDGKTTSVELASIPHDAGATSVPLVALLKAAWPNEDPTHWTFDFFGSDGFHPAARPKCVTPLTYDAISKGRIDLASHDLSFDEALNLPGCYRVRAVVSVEVAK